MANFLPTHTQPTIPLRRKVNGTSLLDIGYNRVGLDDNWQQCGKGINGSFLDPAFGDVSAPGKICFPEFALIGAQEVLAVSSRGNSSSCCSWTLKGHFVECIPAQLFLASRNMEPSLQCIPCKLLYTT